MPMEQGPDKKTPPAPVKTRPTETSLRSSVQQKNRKLGLMLGSWAVSAFAIAIVVAIVVHYVEIHHVLAAH
ncbi:MAG TPA: hypothetical protein VN617_12335 [Rhodoferax sp.]|nr:hypothetical protein [Rhodoferax sp.]